MPKPVGNLVVNIIARTKPFAKGMDAARSRLKRFGSGLKSIGKKVATFSAALTGVSMGGMAYFLKGQMDAIDLLAKTSDSLGMTTEALASMQHAAAITGISNDQLTTGLRRMEKTISDAGVGLKTAQRALEQLGLSADQLKKLSPEQQFAKIGDALKNVSAQADKARIAQDIFGRSGQALINTLNLGSQGLADMRAEAERLGITFSRKEAAKVERFNDAMTRLKELVGGFGRGIVIRLAPGVAEAVEGLVLLFQMYEKRKAAAADMRAKENWFERNFRWSVGITRWATGLTKQNINKAFQQINTNQAPTARGMNRNFMQPFTPEQARKWLREAELNRLANEKVANQKPTVEVAMP